MKKILTLSAILLCIYSNLFASQLSVEPKETKVTGEVVGEEADPNSFKLRSIIFESSPTKIQIKIEGTGNFAKVHEEKFFNPGRLMLEIPQIENGINLNIGELTDHIIIPRIRLAEHPQKLRIIIDTVLRNFPSYNIQKNDHQIILTLEKNSEMLQEAKSRAELFLAMQRNDRDALLKLGSEDEGGVLFADGSTSSSPSSSPLSATSSTASAGTASPEVHTIGGAGGVQVQPGQGPGNRIVFMLDDRREYKIFVEDTQTPIHIQKIRPVYEVKGIQSRLNLMGYDTGGVDGDVGPKTKASLRAFQKSEHLAGTGTPTKSTQRELKKRFGY